MALQLWLMRHGIAEDPDAAGSDDARALTNEGRQQVVRAAAWLRERVAAPELVWHSPLRRTTETAHAVAETMGIATPPQSQLIMAPGMDAERLLAAVGSSAAEIILCVGHQPDIGAAIHDCVGGGRCAVPPGTIAAIDFRGPVVLGGGTLQWSLTPDWFG